MLYANGTGTLAPANEASFGFGTSGQIIELNVKIGDTVEAGQVIGKMDDTEVQAAYEQAKRNLADLTTPAAIAAAEQSVADAEVSIYNAKQDLEYLISSDVYYWEGKVAAARRRLSSQRRQMEAQVRPLNRSRKSTKQAQRSAARRTTSRPRS